jgi:hypothetical protein
MPTKMLMSWVSGGCCCRSSGHTGHRRVDGLTDVAGDLPNGRLARRNGVVEAVADVVEDPTNAASADTE